jgi:hypothetical protein
VLSDLTLTETIWAVIVGTLGVARMARLVVFDEYPPMKWVRVRWHVLTGESDWKKLMECAFCCAPYLAAGDMAWAWFSDFHWSWWVFNVWLSVSYVAAMIVARDEPED